MTKLFCEYCLSRLFEDDRNCPACGAPTKNSVQKTEEENYNSIVLNGNWYDDVYALAIAGGNFYVKQDSFHRLEIFALSPNKEPFQPPYRDLAFNSSDLNSVLVSNDGEVFAIKGNLFKKNIGKDSVITVKIRNKPKVYGECAAVICA